MFCIDHCSTAAKISYAQIYRESLCLYTHILEYGNLIVACVLAPNRGRTLSRSQVGLKQKCLFWFSQKCEISVVLVKFHEISFHKIFYSRRYRLSVSNVEEIFGKIAFFSFSRNFTKISLILKKHICFGLVHLFSTKLSRKQIFPRKSAKQKYFHKNGPFVLHVADKFCLFCNIPYFRKSQHLLIFAKIFFIFLYFS